MVVAESNFEEVERGVYVLKESVSLEVKRFSSEIFKKQTKNKIKKAQRHQLTSQEHAELLREVAEVATSLYPVKFGQCIAIKLFTGEIVESAEKELDLLRKLQGKSFGSPIFVWKSGFSSFAGWKTRQQQ